MGCIFSKNNEPNIQIHDCIPQLDQFDYLRLHGTITVSLDRKYNITIVDIKFDGWFENSVRLWPNIVNRKSNFCCLKELRYQFLVLVALVRVIKTEDLTLFFSHSPIKNYFFI